MKNVMVLLHEDSGQEARLQAALDLTRALSGHLLCLDVVVPPAAVSDYLEVSGGAVMMEYVREHESENRRAVEARLLKEDVSWSILDRIGAPGRELRNADDLADIIVLSIPGDDAEPEFRRIIGEMAVKSGRPVLAVPPECRSLDLAGNAVVGWNASHEAGEAVRQAVPVLQHAASVTILDVNHPAGDFSVQEAASYLSRHGIKADIVTRESDGDSISDVILDEAHARSATFVVIGAYGLPRPIETIFGGVTEGMLRKTDLPVFLAR